ncbi:aqualysin-1-like [Amphiura filiformis]|uniref:aqualysin-1-like n=1 Tax=Amphiura filiformis TaxID=82378 RepID=UPI003B217A30
MRAFVCLLLFIAVASAELARLEKVMEPIPGQYIVVLKDETNLDKFISSMELGAVAQGIQTEIRYKFGHVLNGFSLRIPDTFVEWLRGLDGVEYIEEAGVVRPQASQYNPPWGLDRINQENLPLDYWYSYTYTGYGVNVYVIDSGIRYSHNDFGGRAYSFWDFQGGYGEDCNGHGTHCSGTIGGYTYGVAKNVILYNARVFPCSGSSSTDTIIAVSPTVFHYHYFISFYLIITAMDYVGYYGLRPAVVSMSLGGGASNAQDLAVRNLYYAGFVVSVAAGNDNANACYYSPARAPEAITVGATDSYDVRSTFSNYGSCLDLFAPGTDITSAWYRSDSDSATISGTSMACPHVSGACAKLLEYAPGYTPADIASVLIYNSAYNKLYNIGSGSPNILLYQSY